MAEKAITYRMADGSLVYGEFTTVSSLEGWFDDNYEPVELIEEVWILESRTELTHHSTGCHCRECRPDFYDEEEDSDNQDEAT